MLQLEQLVRGLLLRETVFEANEAMASVIFTGF